MGPAAPPPAPLLVRGDLPADLADMLAQHPRMAWDVETSGLDWRIEKLGTCQLFVEGSGPIIVQLDGGRPTRLAALLGDENVVKVFHHAPFDLRFMVHEWGAKPQSVLCTKVASKLLSPSSPTTSHSLQALLADCLGVTLPKGAVRTSNWLSGDLSVAQITYAAEDVVHLLELVDALLDRLRGAGLEDMYWRCCAFLPTRVDLEVGGFPDVFAY